MPYQLPTCCWCRTTALFEWPPSLALSDSQIGDERHWRHHQRSCLVDDCCLLQGFRRYIQNDRFCHSDVHVPQTNDRKDASNSACHPGDSKQPINRLRITLFKCLMFPLWSIVRLHLEMTFEKFKKGSVQKKCSKCLNFGSGICYCVLLVCTIFLKYSSLIYSFSSALPAQTTVPVLIGDFLHLDDVHIVSKSNELYSLDVLLEHFIALIKAGMFLDCLHVSATYFHLWVALHTAAWELLPIGGAVPVMANNRSVMAKWLSCEILVMPVNNVT